ncbi:MAG: molybdopterin cofactor-binding domain-containing protein [Pseudomonadota bacterium]
MGRVRTIARRSFLVGSAAIVGGVAFGTYMMQRQLPNPLENDLADGATTFNPWVLIDGEKVTLITPHGDKGQGVLSAQAALIAEELDIEFGQFETSFGKPSSAYWNRAFAEEGVPFKSTDEGFTAESLRAFVRGVTKLMSLQGTGGSTSMADSFEKLREAGAVARETLKKAASEETGIPVEQLTTSNGAVQLPDGSALKYTELAARAATLEPVTNVALRDPAEWRLIGKPMERLDIVGKSTGTLPYGIDLTVNGMVHAAVRTNPRQGGTMESFDASAAKTMRGVKDIIEITGGIAVIADNTWRAITAANAVDIAWGPAPYPHEQEAHWNALAASFGEDNLDSMWRDDGDVEAAITDTDTVTAEYRSPYVAHAPLEPLNAIIRVTDDAVEVWTGHQMPIMLTQQVAAITGHDAEQVIFHNQFMGGSFGHRLEFEHIKQTAEIANKMRRTPVKLTYSREEDFTHDFPRHISMGRCRGTVANGQITAIDVNIAAPSVIGSQMGRAGLSVPGPDAQIAAGAWNNPYRIENFRMCAFRAPELAPVSSWRAVGAPGAGFVFDTFIDELCHAAGADPLEERLRLIDHDASRKVLEAVGEMSNWGSDLGPGRGRGVAFVESFGVPTAEVIEVTDTEDGIKVDRVYVAADVGRVIDPVNFENLVQGGVVYGLGHAMNCEITYSDGMAEQTNYDTHDGMRFDQCPEIIVRGLENQSKIRGIGEPPVPPAAPALGNAIFAATGQRLRALPFGTAIDFA